MSVSGVVWDFGNVLISWDPAAAIAPVVGEQEARRFLSEFDFAGWNMEQDRGRSWADGLADLERDHPEWLRHGRAYLDNVTACYGIVPGTHEILREIDAAGVPQFGLTNWSAELYPHAPATYDVIGLLRDVVVSGNVRMAKPDPEIYRLSTERAGIAPERLAFIDDNPTNVAAAAALGMRALRFTDAESLREDLRALGLPV